MGQIVDFFLEPSYIYFSFQILEDPSQQVRPDDPKFKEENPETHRDYSKGGKHYDRVHRTYHQMHTNQTVEYGKEMRNKVRLIIFSDFHLNHLILL